MPWIFTYSDLGPQVIEKLLERAPFCSLPATLPSYKVVFKGRSRKWGGAVATLERAKKSWVYGSALLLPEEEIRVIDKYYSAFDSKEKNILLDATGDKVKAKVYYLKDSVPYGQPSDDYLKAILKHLKFFWGQDGSGKMSLANFNIATEPPPEKKSRRKKSTTTEDEPKIEDAPEEKENEKPKRRRRRTVKKR